MLTAQSATPSTFLSPFIQQYVQRKTAANEAEIIEPVLPRAGAMLEFQFGSVYDVKALGTGRLRPSWAATVIGPIDAHRVRLILRDHVQSMVVLFRPLGLYRLFRIPLSPLTGAGTEGHAVLGPQVSSLYQRLGNAESFGDRVRLLDSFFLHRLQRVQSLDPTARAMHRLASGGCNVGDAARMIGISERQFGRRSLEWAGVSPKALARVSRFQRAIGEYRSSQSSWLDIAHKVGYYDQMHLVRDFHDLGGGPPTQVLKKISEEHLISFCCGRSPGAANLFGVAGGAPPSSNTGKPPMRSPSQMSPDKSAHRYSTSTGGNGVYQEQSSCV
ncbi:helix-turn-helix domain-containing protein [Granulicella arctica]|uniref:helix-turn-helix domain-containing protein n=1 Tax=Granulicella arctica TaxID=940613 RepID=UPI0021E0DCB2|nr:AraC family transcriptional regulator [Granulicella arctica]